MKSDVYLSQQQLNMQNMIDTITYTEYISSEGIVVAWRGNVQVASLNIYSDVLEVFTSFNPIWDRQEIADEKIELKKCLYKVYEDAQDLQFIN